MEVTNTTEDFRAKLVIYSLETNTMKVVRNIFESHLDVAVRKHRTSGNCQERQYFPANTKCVMLGLPLRSYIKNRYCITGAQFKNEEHVVPFGDMF